VISEIAVAGGGALLDADGNESGWIELSNPTDHPVSMCGFSLTDDPDHLDKWSFPDVSIEASGFLIVFTSGEDRSGEELHTNFELSQAGEFLALAYGGRAEEALEPTYPAQIPHFSYARLPDSDAFRHSHDPTPSEINVFSDAMRVEDETFTVSGEIQFASDFTVPSDFVWKIEPGSQLSMGDDVWITVHGRVEALGTAQRPIVFAADGDGYWRGIQIRGRSPTPDIDDYWPWILQGDAERERLFLDHIDGGSQFAFCEFRDLATAEQCFDRENKWIGAIEAYDTSLRVSHSSFERVRYISGVLTQRSHVVVDHCTFDDWTIHKPINSTDSCVGIIHDNAIDGHRTEGTRCADGIWLRSFVGLVSANRVDAVGDDGIDTDDTKALIIDNHVTDCWDDGIDVDDGGHCYVLGNQVSGTVEHGILVSDQSRVIASDNGVSSSRSGLCVRDGGLVVAQGQTFTDNESGIMIYQNLPCALTDADYASVKEQLRALTPEEIEEQVYIGGTTDPEDLIGMLDATYRFDGEYWMFDVPDFTSISEFDDIKKIFKLVDVLALEYVVTDQTLAHPLTAALYNELYLGDSWITDNGEDASLWHGYCLDVDEVEFSTHEVAAQVEEMCDPGNCARKLVEGPEVAQVVEHGRDLADRIEAHFGE